MSYSFYSLLAVSLLAGLALAADNKPEAVVNLKASYPRSLEEIKKALVEISAAGPKSPDALTAEREAGLRRLRAYRYLAEVPVDVVLDDELNRYAQAASKLCAKLGRLEHRPANPGLPEEDYRLGLKGTTQSNLAFGDTNLAQAIDGWMDDSDPSNIERLGHRRWCLNPLMQKTGLGRTDRFAALFSFDSSRQMVPDFTFVPFPPRGFMPVEYFRPGWAWNISLHPRKYRPLDPSVKPVLTEVDQELKKVGDPLKLNFLGVDHTGFGIPNCLIFRPEPAAVKVGKRYLVEIVGLKPAVPGVAMDIRYLVELVTLK